MRERSKNKAIKDHLQNLKEIHEKVHENLERSYKKYKAQVGSRKRKVTFEIGELVRMYLPRERYPRGDYNKLTRPKFGSYEIFEKFGENVYQVKLLDDMHISNIFNVRHLHKYHGENTSLRLS